MCVKIFGILFILASICTVVQMTMLNLGITKRMSPMKASDFVSSVTAMLLLYVLCGLILTVLISGKTKFIMLFLAIMPFLAGYFAQYKTYETFTRIQNLIMICGIIYIGKIIFFCGV